MLAVAESVEDAEERLRHVEEALVSRPLQPDVVYAAAARAAEGAEPRERNAFKVALLPRTVERALRTVGGLS